MSPSNSDSLSLELTAILLSSQSSDKVLRRQAEEQLSAAEEKNFEAFVVQLAKELHSEKTPPVARQLAGIVLKNAISGVELMIDREKRTKWSHISFPGRDGIKALVLATLNSPCEEAQAAACQVIAKVGRVELVGKNWPQLLPTLMHAVTAADIPKNNTKAAITAISYLCEDMSLLAEEVNADLLPEENKNTIMTMVSHAMQSLDVDIQIAGCKAFYHTLYFARSNMANQKERDYIFQLIGKCLSHADLRIQHASWECVLQLAADYYDFLDAYARDLGTYSIDTIGRAISVMKDDKALLDTKRQTEAVALAAIEFWNTLCDIECCMSLEEGTENMPASQSKNYIKRAQAVLLPVLLDSMSQKTSEENSDSDEWTLAMASGTCLGLCAQVLKDDILEIVIPFVDDNFNNVDWNRREAAILAYGSIMEGPSTEKLKPLVEKSCEFLCKALQDRSVAVRDTTAWTIGRIASFQIECLIPLLGTLSHDGLINLLIQKLKDEPQVASYVCFALHEIARNLQLVQQAQLLDPFFQVLADHLMGVIQRSDAMEHNLRASAFETLAELVEIVVDPQLSNVLEALLQNLLMLLERTSTVPINEEVNQFRGRICGCCNSIINRLGKIKTSLDLTPKLFRAFAFVIDASLSNSALEAQSALNLKPGHMLLGDEKRVGAGCEEEDAALAIGTLIRNFPQNMEAELKPLIQILNSGLQLPYNVRFCRACIGVVCETAGAFVLRQRNISAEITPLIPILYKLLQDRVTPISLKPPLITTVGDIIVGMGEDFEPYFVPFLELLQQAAYTKISDGPRTEEWLEYFQELRDSVLEAYSCILHGLMESNTFAVLKPHMNEWLSLIRSVVMDEFFSLSNYTKAVDVTCDLVAAFRNELAAHLVCTPFYQAMLDKGEKINDPALSERLAYLRKAIMRCTVF